MTTMGVDVQADNIEWSSPQAKVLRAYTPSSQPHFGRVVMLELSCGHETPLHLSPHREVVVPLVGEIVPCDQCPTGDESSLRRESDAR